MGTRPNPAKTRPVEQGWVLLWQPYPTYWVDFLFENSLKSLKIAVLSDLVIILVIILVILCVATHFKLL